MSPKADRRAPAPLAGREPLVDAHAHFMHAGTGRWGQFELAFRGPTGNPVVRWLSEPMVLMLLPSSAAAVL